jgi:hypothetical protein
LALDFIDSCAHSGTGSNQIPITRKWTSSGQASYTNSPSRVAGGAIAITGAIAKTLSYKSERWLGAAYYFPGSASTAIVMSFQGSGNNLTYIKVESDRTVSIYAGGSNVLLYNSGAQHLVLTPDKFHYIEFHCLLGGSTPITLSLDMKIDGQTWASGVTGNSFYNASNMFTNTATMNQIFFGAPIGGGFVSYICDIYCVNADSTDINGHPTTLNTFLGDISIVPNVPISDNTTNWTPNMGSSHFALVDEIPPDDDTTYVSSNTVGNVDDYTFQQLTGFTGTLLGAQLLVYAKKDAEGSRTIEGLVGGTAQTNNNGTQQFLSDYYDYYIFPLDSDNGTAWTPTNYNAEHFGVKLSA